MSFIVKKHSKEEFFPIYSRWLESQNFPHIADVYLPENVFVCYTKDEIPCYAVWFYHTDSKMAQVGFPASNRNVSYKKKEGGLRYLFQEVSKYGKRKGYLRLFTTSDTENVEKALEGAEYVKGEVTKHYFKIL